MRKQGLIVVAMVALIGVMITGCGKRYKTIPDDEVVLIFRELYLTNAYLNTQKTITYQQIDSVDVYRPVLDRYGYTTGDLKHSLANFSKKKSSRISDLLEQVIIDLEQEKKEREYLVMSRDSIDARLYRKYARTIYEDSLITAKKVADTAKLRLVIPTPKVGIYRIDYHYMVDTLDKNSGIKTLFTVYNSKGKQTDHHAYWMAARMFRQKQGIELEIKKGDREIEIVFGNYKKEGFKAPYLDVSALTITYHLPKEEALERLVDEICDYKLLIDGKEYEWLQPHKENSRTLYIYPRGGAQTEDSGGGSNGNDTGAGELSEPRN